jgi:hypothetical protein
MMNNINEKLSEIFDVEPIEINNQPKVNTEVVVVAETNTSLDLVDSDTEFARQNIRELIKKGGFAIDQILEVAKQSEHPRAYEVAAGFIKNMADLNKDLLELQKRKKELHGVSGKESSKDVNIDKAVFVGSTAELMKLIKNKE